jgi:FlaA1/EpsC-like NDP-sugar epimerase
MSKGSHHNRICIIGAGFAGREIAEELSRKEIFGKVALFLDDDHEKIGTSFNDIPIDGPIDRAGEILSDNPANEAIVAIPGASKDQLKRIYALLKKTNLKRIRILPALSQIIDGDAHLIQARELDAQDLLARNPVAIPLKESLEYLRGKRVLITGAGGSIGSELARQLLSGGAQRLFLFDHGENNVYEIERELRILQEEGVGEKATIVPVLGELQDDEYMRFILKRLRADVIFHCAAYKHVPLIEENPVAAIKNNVFGTRNIVDAAEEAGVSRFVLISTDKAVEPVSVYGSSKMLAEEIVLQKNNSRQHFMVVRFGNVLNSRGSIVPLFRQQIFKGGPVTITHPEMRRFFMTIPEAASLVLKAGGVGEGGNLYILEMGEPILILDIVEQMIRFYGFIPEEEIPIRTIGFRPGEKLDEALWSVDEVPEETDSPGIKRLLRAPRFEGGLESLLSSLSPVCFYDETRKESYRNRILLRRILKPFIPSLEIPPDEPEY